MHNGNVENWKTRIDNGKLNREKLKIRNLRGNIETWKIRQGKAKNVEIEN